MPRDVKKKSGPKGVSRQQKKIKINYVYRIKFSLGIIELKEANFIIHLYAWHITNKISLKNKRSQ